MRELYYVNYYKDFRCIGPACENTCCAMWEIEIDDRSYERYKNYPGKWGKRFADSIDHGEQCFRMRRRDCIFLNEKHLCDIQAELGEEMLCRTCKIFPRHMEEYGGRREFFLSLACPEAARRILFKKDPAYLYKKERKGRIPDGEADKELLKILLVLREGLLRILHTGNQPLQLRICMILALGHDAQRTVKQKDMETLKKLFIRYENAGGLTDAERVELACWYSCEVENSRNNLEALDMVLAAHPEFSLEKLLACLAGSYRLEGTGDKKRGAV